MFNAKKATQDCIQWIRDWFEVNGKGCNAVVGISGGKDSTIVAALCVAALGKDRVIGVLMPNGYQDDFNEAVRVCENLEIEWSYVNIKDAYESILNGMDRRVPTRANGEYKKEPLVVSEQTKTNLPPRLRMSVLYAISQSRNGRVANTCNLSEDWIGYSTRYGDSVGDFSPLSRFTATEVKEIGRELYLPDDFVDKVPSDGLCGKTDEDNFGFTYAVLDRYIREGVCEDENIKAKIDTMHERNLFKLQLMPVFEYKDGADV